MCQPVCGGSSGRLRVPRTDWWQVQVYGRYLRMDADLFNITCSGQLWPGWRMSWPPGLHALGVLPTVSVESGMQRRRVLPT